MAGWLDLADAATENEAGGDPATLLNAAGDAFNHSAANHSKKELEPLMGKARLCVVREAYTEALDVLNQVVVNYAWFLPDLVEKFGVLVAIGDWEQAVETAQRVLAEDARNIEALRLTILYLLSQVGGGRRE